MVNTVSHVILLLVWASPGPQGHKKTSSRHNHRPFFGGASLNMVWRRGQTPGAWGVSCCCGVSGSQGAVHQKNCLLEELTRRHEDVLHVLEQKIRTTSGACHPPPSPREMKLRDENLRLKVCTVAEC